MPTLAVLLLALAQQTAPGTAAAPVPPPVAASTPVAGVVVKGSADEVVCKREAMTGSRLQAPKVCRTRGEWADMATQAREATQQIQSQRASGPH